MLRRVLACVDQLAKRRRGFRLSWTDIAIIVACLIATVILYPSIGPLVLVGPITLGHFCLFCNVFRIRRAYELIWAVAFVFNFGMWSFFADISWYRILAVQTPLTVLLIGCEFFSSRYHGVGCRSELPTDDDSTPPRATAY